MTDLTLSSDVTEPVVDRLEDVHFETGLAKFDVYRDWLDLCIYGLARQDEPYLEIVDEYRDRFGEDTGEDCIETYANALGALTAATIEADHEVLGLVYEQLGHSSDSFGQYFTPHNVSDAMAAMTVSAEGAADADPPLTVHDPACGSGRLLISVAKRVHEFDDPPPLFVSGQDRDPVCAKMTAVNLALASCWGRAIQGDSMLVEQQRVFHTNPRWDVVLQIDDDPPDTSIKKIGEEPAEPDMTTGPVELTDFAGGDDD